MPSADDRIDAVGVDLEELPNYVAEGIARQTGDALREAHELTAALLALDGEEPTTSAVRRQFSPDGGHESGMVDDWRHEYRVEKLSRHGIDGRETEEQLREWSEEGYEIEEATLFAGDVVFILRRSAPAEDVNAEGDGEGEAATDGGHVVHEYKVYEESSHDLVGRSTSEAALTSRHSGTDWEFVSALETGADRVFVLRRPAHDLYRA